MKRNAKKIGWMVVGLAMLTLVACNQQNPSNVEATANEPSVVPTNDSQKTSIQVTGSGFVYAEPSIANVQIGVTTDANETAVALEENKKATDQLLNALVGTLIEEGDIETMDFSVYPKYDVEDYTKIVGYTVTHMFSVTVRDLEKVGVVIDEAVANGSNMTSYIQFDISEEERQQYYEEALKIAIDSGEKKASAIAGIRNITLGEPVRIIEGTQGNIDQPMMRVEEKADASIIPGSLRIDATVTMIY